MCKTLGQGYHGDSKHDDMDFQLPKGHLKIKSRHSTKTEQNKDCQGHNVNVLLASYTALLPPNLRHDQLKVIPVPQVHA